MASSNQFEIGAVYDFITYAPSILGTYKNVRVEGIVNHTASRYYIDPAAMHANVYSTLPEGTINDYRQYNYLMVKTTSNNIYALGLPWIDGDSVVRKSFQKAYVTIEDVGPEDVEKIRLALVSNGYTPSKIILE